MFCKVYTPHSLTHKWAFIKYAEEHILVELEGTQKMINYLHRKVGDQVLGDNQLACLIQSADAEYIAGIFHILPV